MNRQTKLGGTFTLPGTSLNLYRMGYGAMQLAGPGVWGLPANIDEAVAVLRDAVAAGVNHIDTSDFYGPSVTNQLIKQVLHPYPYDLVIVTKSAIDEDPQNLGFPRFRAMSSSRQLKASSVRRARATTLSPAASAASAMSRPNPFPLPVINQTLDMKILRSPFYIDYECLESASWIREKFATCGMEFSLPTHAGDKRMMGLIVPPFSLSCAA